MQAVQHPIPAVAMTPAEANDLAADLLIAITDAARLGVKLPTLHAFYVAHCAAHGIGATP